MTTKTRKKQLERMKKQRKVRRPEYVLLPIPSEGFPSVNYSAFVKGISERDPAIWDAILQFLGYFEGHHFEQFGIDAIREFNKFAQLVFAAIMDEEFQPNQHQAMVLVQMGHIFQHLLEVSGYKTTDPVLSCVLNQQKNLAKVLFLQNAMCEIQVNQSKFFDIDPIIASAWFSAYGLGIGTPHPTIQKNVYRHFENMDERWQIYRPQVSSIYFTCTYHNPGAARRCKSIMNKAIKKFDLGTKFTNRPSEGKKHIAIVSCRWHRNHAVYKSLGALVEQLLDKYKLSLIWTGPTLVETAVTSYFDSVTHCYFKGGDLIVPPTMLDNDYDMVYYPDIGMSDESIWLSNQRIAPIQVMGYGHPETTGDGSEIDYLIGGREDDPNQYAETMLQIPGLGADPTWPTYERKHNYIDDDVVRINCSWGPDKYNYTLLSVLAEINKVAANICQEQKKEASWEWHLFGSPGMNRYAALPAFNMYVKQLLPNAIIHSRQEYYDYMENAEQHDFALNSFPFGCYNVLVESLFLGIPFATLVGDRFYSRAGKWLNEKAGMPENSFDIPRDMINWVARIITEPELLKAQREHLKSLDLKSLLFDKNKHFLDAVDHIFGNHPFNETVLIGEGQ